MEKKELKMYEAPAVEIVEVEAQGVICASGSNAGNVGNQEPEIDWD